MRYTHQWKGTSSTYKEVSYVIDHLYQDYLTFLIECYISNEQDLQEVSRCSLIHELEELVPDQVSIDQILNLPQLLNELQSSALDLRLAAIQRTIRFNFNVLLVGNG